MSHTPGPWGAFTGKVKSTGATEHFVQPEAATTEFGGIVAVLPLGTYPVETQSANAKLIAAAPDLLAAAELALELEGLQAPEAFAALEAAVKKARGET